MPPYDLLFRRHAMPPYDEKDYLLAGYDPALRSSLPAGYDPALRSSLPAGYDPTLRSSLPAACDAALRRKRLSFGGIRSRPTIFSSGGIRCRPAREGQCLCEAQAPAPVSRTASASAAPVFGERKNRGTGTDSGENAGIRAGPGLSSRRVAKFSTEQYRPLFAAARSVRCGCRRRARRVREGRL